VNAQDVLERHGEDVAPRRLLGLVFLQLVLGGEGQRRKIGERPDGGGLDPGLLELAAVERTVRGGMSDLLAQAPCLHPRHLGA